MYMVSFAQNFVYARTYTPYELFTDYTWCDNDYWYKFEPAVAFFATVFFSVLTQLPLVCIYASVNQVSIGSDNGVSPIPRGDNF